MRERLTSLLPAMWLSAIKADCGGKELRDTAAEKGGGVWDKEQKLRFLK